MRNLSAPKVVTWWIAVILGVLGVLGYLGAIAGLSSEFAFWLVVAGLVLLVLATLLKDL